MARTRKVESSTILAAAERVVLTQGMSHFSLDAVAREAGISKTRVIYDFKSKTDLIIAMMERQCSKDMEALEEIKSNFKDTPNPELFARMKLAERNPDESDQAVAIVVSASLLSEKALQEKMQAWIRDDIEAVTGGNKPRASLLAYFALMGFCCHEWFGLISFSDSERKAILKDIGTAFLHFPETENEPLPTRKK
jgi:AcrR family transcriptional regulator